jgi:hypothetical protein
MTMNVLCRRIALWAWVVACVEETIRVIWACASSISQVSRWRGVVLGNKWASVSQTSKDAKEPILLNNPPSIYTWDGERKGLTKTGKEPTRFTDLATLYLVTDVAGQSPAHARCQAP